MGWVGWVGGLRLEIGWVSVRLQRLLLRLSWVGVGIWLKRIWRDAKERRRRDVLRYGYKIISSDAETTYMDFGWSSHSMRR